MLLLEDVTYASSVFGTYVIIIISKLCCVPQIRFDLELILLFINFISTELCVCDLYLLNHAILVVKWILLRSFVILSGLPGLYK